MAKHGEYIVEPRGDDWIVKLPHAKRASAIVSTEKKAIAQAKKFAPEGVVHVKKPNGKFRKV